ncbi:MAG: RidA family protein [Pseudomonadota bacterium]
MSRQAVSLPGRNALYEKNTYAPAIISGGFVFVSGQVGNRDDGSVVEDPAEQVAKAFENLGRVLDAAGCSFDDVIDVTTFHVDLANTAEHLWAPKQKHFGSAPYPNWTAVGVAALVEGYIFEIKVIARLPETKPT